MRPLLVQKLASYNELSISRTSTRVNEPAKREKRNSTRRDLRKRLWTIYLGLCRHGCPFRKTDAAALIAIVKTERVPTPMTSDKLNSMNVLAELLLFSKPEKSAGNTLCYNAVACHKNTFTYTVRTNGFYRTRFKFVKHVARITNV